MSEFLTSHPGALRMLMTDEVFLLKEEEEAVIKSTSEQTAPEAEPALPADFTYLGENNKYFAILVKDDKHTHLNKEHQEMLLKIMQAKGLDLRDVAILNIRRYPGLHFKAIKEFFAPSRIVLFGINPQLLGFPSMASNEPGSAENIKLLTTYHFDEMKDDVNKKRALWNALKTF